MSSQLTPDETAEESRIERGDREVTVTFKISAEALDTLVPRGTTQRQFNEAIVTLLACGIYTKLQAIRELQHTEVTKTHDASGNEIVPGVRRKDELRRAGRLAQIALTNLEDVALWADKAVVWTR
jgi:hypothetical protein